MEAELCGAFLTEDDWQGDAPYTGFFDRLSPPATVRFKSKALRRLQERTLFKLEAWSAPDVGGLVRAYIGGKQKADATHVVLALDWAMVNGEARVIAAHELCVNCDGTGLVDGATCTHVDALGVACLDGRHFKGGLAIDAGERGETVRLHEPADLWSALMAR